MAVHKQAPNYSGKLCEEKTNEWYSTKNWGQVTCEKCLEKRAKKKPDDEVTPEVFEKAIKAVMFLK